MRKYDNREQYYKDYYQRNKEKLLGYQHAYIKAKRDGTFQPKQITKQELPTDVENLYYTREELEEAEPSIINWYKWCKLVEQTKQDIQDLLSDRKGIVRYVYNTYGQLIQQGTSKQLESLLKPYTTISKENITKYSNGNKIKDGLYYTNIKHYKWERLLQAIEQAKNVKA